MSRRRKGKKEAARPQGSELSPLDGEAGPKTRVDLGGGLRISHQEIRFLLQHKETFSGPLPHPRHFEAYEKVLPGASERLLKMAETQSAHRQSLESSVVRSDIRKEAKGQYFAFILGMTGVLGGIWLMSSGHSLEGASTFIGSLAALAGLFVWARRASRSELEEKKRESAAPSRLPEQVDSAPGS